MSHAAAGEPRTLGGPTLVVRVAANPLAFQRAHGETRRAVLARFPYAIYFRVVGDEIVVLALHGRQHQSHWRARS
jgi:plasmid stabilization system protein ParE